MSIGVKNAETSFAEDMWVDAFRSGKHTDSAGNTRELDGNVVS